MGKRKGRRKPPPKKKYVGQKLSTVFNCPFCNHAKSVEVKIRAKEHEAFLKCVKCEESYETQSSYLTEPIDVYAEWMDAIASATENNEKTVVQDDDGEFSSEE